MGKGDIDLPLSGCLLPTVCGAHNSKSKHVWAIYMYSEASFIRDAFIRKHRYPDGFSRERKKRNVILLHLARNPCFRNRTVVWGTKPCFTMPKDPCYPDTRQSVIDFKANWQYKHCVAYPCLVGDSITFVNR